MAAWVALASWFQRAVINAFGAVGQHNDIAPVIPDGGGAFLQLDGSGNLLVVPGVGAVWVVGGPEPQDDPVAGNPVEISFEAEAIDGGAFNTNVPVSNDGDVVRPKASRFGVQYTMLVTEDGARVAIYPDDAAYAIGTRGGAAIFGVRNDAAAGNRTTADSHYSPISVDQKGQVFVTFSAAMPGGPVFAEDSAHASGDLGFNILVRRADTATSSGSTDGDYVELNQDADGYLYIRDKSYDPPTNATRNLPVWSEVDRRTPGDIPVQLIAAAQNVTNAEATLGNEIDVSGYTRITFRLDWTKNDGDMSTLKFILKDRSDGTNYFNLPIYNPSVAATPYVVLFGKEVCQYSVNESASLTLTWDLANTTRKVQLYVLATTPGAPAPATINTKSNYSFGWGS